MPFELRDIGKCVVQAIDKDQNGTLSGQNLGTAANARALEGVTKAAPLFDSNQSINDNDLPGPLVSLFGSEYYQCAMLSPAIQQKIEQKKLNERNAVIKGANILVSKAESLAKNWSMAEGALDVVTDATKMLPAMKQAAAVGFETMSGGRVRVRPDSAERASNTANSIGFHVFVGSSLFTKLISCVSLQKIAVSTTELQHENLKRKCNGESSRYLLEHADEDGRVHLNHDERLMWHVLAHEVGLQKKRGWENVSHGGLQIPESCIPNIQKKFVRLFRFSLAKIVWGYYVEPCLEEITQSDRWQIKNTCQWMRQEALFDALFHGDSGRH